MIKEWLDSYHPGNKEEALNALREIMQEVALAGLYRAGFFARAAFYGGTALRIFYGLNRFSEDLDFSLLDKDPGFSLDRYLGAIQAEFESLGMRISFREKEKTNQTNIESAFLKSETIETLSENQFRSLLREKIDSVDFARIKADISRFIADPGVLEIWSPRYFHDLAGQLRVDDKKLPD